MSTGSGPTTPVLAIAERHGKAAALLLVATAAFLPLVPQLVPLTAVLAFAVLAYRYRNTSPAAVWKDLRSPWPYMIALYLLHVAGMLWSANTDFGLFDLQIKAPLLLLPLLLGWCAGRLARDHEPLLFIFGLASAVAVVVCVVAALVRIIAGSDFSPAQEVFSSRWSVFLHPSYFAMYLTTSIAAWCLRPMGRTLSPWADRAVLSMLCIGVVLCGSKIGWAILLVLLPVLLRLRWKDPRVRGSLLVVIVLFTSGVLALVAASPYARERVMEMFAATTNEAHDPQTVTSSEVRLLTWSSAWAIFKEDPLGGTGTGDIKDELVAHYKAHGYTGAAEHRLNAHNQFLQMAACLGVLGLLLILAMLVLPLITGARGDPFASIFLVLAAANWMVESMLEVQAGVLFFAFFACLIPWSGTPRRSSPPL